MIQMQVRVIKLFDKSENSRAQNTNILDKEHF